MGRRAATRLALGRRPSGHAVVHLGPVIYYPYGPGCSTGSTGARVLLGVMCCGGFPGAQPARFHHEALCCVCARGAVARGLSVVTVRLCDGPAAARHR